MNDSNTISAIKKDLMGIKSKLEYTDLSLFLNDPDCIFGTKPYYSSRYYFNIKPDEAPNYIERMQRISESIKLITDKLGLGYLLSEVALIKDLAQKSDETYHYPYFFDLYSIACTIEESIKTQINDDNSKTEELDRFSKIMDINKTKALYKLMIDKCYIRNDTNESVFCYWFGYDEPQESIVQIDWVDVQLKDINAFINTFYCNESRKWEKAVKAFTWKSNNIRKKSLSTAIDSISRDPDSKKIFEDFRKS